MPVPWKYRRLLRASQRFNNFHRLVDVVTVALFLVIAVAVANRLLPQKLVNHAYLIWSWQTITVAGGLFLFLFAAQVYYEKQGRILSDFQKEAALKAARKDNYRKPT